MGKRGHGLDALLNPWNVVLGLAVFFLARILGALYFINNIAEDDLVRRCRRALWGNTALFLLFFLAFIIRTLLADGYAVRPETGEVFMEPYKYLTNFLEMPVVLVLFLAGVVAVLWGIVRTLWKPAFDKGIWFAGAGTVLTVLALLLVAGYNNTAYYPSTADLQSSLTLANSCSSLFTLRVMAYVSLLVPFVLAYIFYAWRSIDSRKIDAEEMEGEDTGIDTPDPLKGREWFCFSEVRKKKKEVNCLTSFFLTSMIFSLPLPLAESSARWHTYIPLRGGFGRHSWLRRIRCNPRLPLS